MNPSLRTISTTSDFSRRILGGADRADPDQFNVACVALEEPQHSNFSFFVRTGLDAVVGVEECWPPITEAYLRIERHPLGLHGVEILSIVEGLNDRRGALEQSFKGFAPRGLEGRTCYLVLRGHVKLDQMGRTLRRLR